MYEAGLAVSVVFFIVANFYETEVNVIMIFVQYKKPLFKVDRLRWREYN